MKPTKPGSSPFKIPLFDLDIGEDEIKAVEKVLRSKWLTMGDVTRRFEEEFARFLDVPYCFAVTNGTAALHLAVLALGIGPGDEVICPSLTFVATANAILYAGASPIFADITGKHDLNISAESIESKITNRTKAIMVVHYGGFPCQMDKILDIARRYNLKVIEDAAHAPGAEFIWRNGQGRITNTKKAGTIGDIGCFSFFSNKNLATGEGGMVVTRNGGLAEKIKILRSHGMTTLTLDRYRGHSYSYDVVDLGYNYRIDEIRSALGLVQLGELKEKNERREALATCYQERLREMEGLGVPFQSFTHKSSHHIFPVLLQANVDREVFMNELREKRIQTSVHYPPIHQFSYYEKRFGKKDKDLTWTEHVGSHEVTLPLYPSLTEEKIHYISECIRSVMDSKAIRKH